MFQKGFTGFCVGCARATGSQIHQASTFLQDAARTPCAGTGRSILTCLFPELCIETQIRNPNKVGLFG